MLESDRGRINAGRTRWLFSAKHFQSDQPVQADLKNSKVQGRGFKLDEHTGNVIIANDCRVEQILEILTARRCAWNWRSERVVADGDVVLERTKPEQITRASRMEARISENGEVRFGQAGARVESTIKLSPAAQEKPRRPQVSF